MNIDCACHREDFIDKGLDHSPCIGARSDLTILRAAQRRDGIQRAIPDEFCPEFSCNIVRNPARYIGARKEICNALGLFAPWPEDEVAAPDMLHPARFRYGSGHIDDRRKRFDRSRGANLLHVIHAVLKTEDQRVWREQRRNGACGGRVVRGLHAKENNFRSPNCAQVRGHFDVYTFLKVQGVEEKSVLLYGLDKRGPPDHHHRSAGARQQSAEVTAHGARSDDGNSWPGFRGCHAVITLIRRSMSRSVLYRCGETRMFPSRKLTTTFSFS